MHDAFVHDATWDGGTLKCLTIVDEFTRQALAIHVARSCTATDTIRVLERLIAEHGRPAFIRSDNGPEFVAKRVQQWLKGQGIETRYIEPGCPWQNGTNESFNGVLRDSCLDRWYFEGLRDAREQIEAFRSEYNEERPHGALKGQTPEEFLKAWRSNVMPGQRAA